MKIEYENVFQNWIFIQKPHLHPSQKTNIFVPKNCVDNLYIEFNRSVEDSISNGFIGSDEKVFDLTYVRNKERYHFVKCTWREYYGIFE